MIALSMAAILTAMLVTVLLAGMHVDRQHADPRPRPPAIVEEAEQIVRSEAARLRRETDHGESGGGVTP
ncbi:hypothetical protein [Phytoactinopolyspora mesophila]|uniref:Uncharacterized protein n=1 Tax=Phytoactinopolyspora mesophila TaxID=2650750 RepID=A0A7K3MC69_9ACTN|nr:hypothetical protein [Phytoactinopolyspora mesophila]NDL60911.1 hypothetical protein [Phytoactinopolyspora mesophila]